MVSYDVTQCPILFLIYSHIYYINILITTIYSLITPFNSCFRMHMQYPLQFSSLVDSHPILNISRRCFYSLSIIPYYIPCYEWCCRPSYISLILLISLWYNHPQATHQAIGQLPDYIPSDDSLYKAKAIPLPIWNNSLHLVNNAGNAIWNHWDGDISSSFRSEPHWWWWSIWPL